MPLFLEPNAEEDLKKNLWSSRYGFAEYGDPADFYKVRKYHETLSHGVTLADYDAYHLAVIRVELPDGCTTHVKYDYHALLPLRIIDANENIQEAIYEPFGQPLADSFMEPKTANAPGSGR